jgi:transposase-like protein
VREGGRIVSLAAIIPVEVKYVREKGNRRSAHRFIGGRAVLASFLRSPVHRGLTRVKLVVSDAHEGLKAAIARILSVTWQPANYRAK